MSMLETQAEALREEAAQEPDPVHTGEVKSETQVIAIYGKGGAGKSLLEEKTGWRGSHHRRCVLPA